MGNAVQEMLGPLIRLPHPEIRDVWSFEETGFHHLLVASVEERFAKEAMRTAMGLLGQGQLGLTKVLWMVGRDVNARSMDDVLAAIADHFDPAEDFHLLTKVPFDTLDFTSTTLNLGSRMILDATPSGRPPSPRPELPDLTTVDRRILGQALLGPSLLAVQVADGEDARAVLKEVLRLLPGSRSALGAGTPGGTATDPTAESSDEAGPPNPKLVAAVSADLPLDDRALLTWGIFTRFDPARDIFFEESRLRGAWPVHRGRMAIDATFKPGYPAALEMDPAVERKVDRRWKEYGIDGDG